MAENNQNVEQNQNVETENQASTQNDNVDISVITKAIETASAKKENAILKDYFSKQGLSEEETKQAINDYKEKRKKEQPDAQTLIKETENLKGELERAKLENQATIIAINLGVDVATVPFLLKMADFSNLSESPTKENIAAELNRVLEAVPGLKKSKEDVQGFQKVGSDVDKNDTNINQEALKNAFGVK